MEKLELNHIAPYLPYKISVKYFGIINGKELGKWDKENKSFDFFFGETEKPKPDEILDWKLGFIKKTETYLYYWKLRVGNGYKNIYDEDFGKTAFLVLRHLSDLTKEIEHNGEKFVPILRLAELNLRQFNWKMIFDSKRAFSDKLYVEFYFNGKDFRCVNQQYDAVAQNQFILFQKLFEWHFDVFGLIEKGLAVDINTLDNG